MRAGEVILAGHELKMSPERRTSGRQQLMHLTAAFNRMPAKCREVVWLQRVEGLA
jgi:DNA-directed RNA polymerase specialized sigma24 family protein